MSRARGYAPVPAPRDDQRQDPPDIATMRAVVDRLLDPDAVPEARQPTLAEIETLTLQLRGHVELLLPEVEETANRLPRSNIPRYCALACVGEARERLRTGPSSRFGGPAGHARRLARTLNALLDHWEALTGGTP
ncbi:hypothetical protein B1R27_30065 [Streptomyces sp. GKU 895]|nr:hypothetical protein B1R27_30065 [Streptomyces sp. GKU 895]